MIHWFMENSTARDWLTQYLKMQGWSYQWHRSEVPDALHCVTVCADQVACASLCVADKGQGERLDSCCPAKSANDDAPNLPKMLVFVMPDYPLFEWSSLPCVGCFLLIRDFGRKMHRAP